MKYNSPFAGAHATACVAAAVISLGLAGEARAQMRVVVTPTAALAGGMIPNAGVEAGMLRQAYGLLATANHDYNGNRAKAMREVEAAAKHLGVSLRGDGKVREFQGASDAQLRSAQALLVQASAGLTGRGLVNIRQAVAHLNIALAIR